MVVAAAKGGFQRGDMEKVLPRVQELPFDSERKRMTTIHRSDGSHGEASVHDLRLSAVHRLRQGRARCHPGSVQPQSAGGQAVALTDGNRKDVLEQNRDMASNALRVLGVAYRPLARGTWNAESRRSREGTDLRRTARHDRSGAPGSHGGGESGERGRAAEASWSPAITRTRQRRSLGRSAC